MAKTIMIQGTSSNVGKSILCTALCRIFSQDGYRTAPFKSQNMALNSAVTPGGGEIGRAQAAQAEAARVHPTVHMNPILLKPKQDQEAQVVVLGKPIGDMSARQYRQEFLANAIPLVKDSLDKLQEEYEVIVIEGAGSPAEINLKDRDIVNMKTAELADAPVLLVGDIDRGGVFASIVGTLELLEPNERERVKGFIINKFRGDLSLLEPGLDWLTARTGIPVLGVIPYMHQHGIDEEDSVSLSEAATRGQEQPIQIAVLELPRISNFTDINPLKSLPDTAVRFVKPGQKIGAADVVIIPGTKNSILDLVYLRQAGYDQEIKALAGTGAFVVGICGGYQMLGEQLLDPDGIEADIGSQPGLGLLPGITAYDQEKTTHQVTACILAGNGFWQELQGQTVTGYEIHMGQTSIKAAEQSLLEINERSGRLVVSIDGMTNDTGRIWGTHLHGLFENTNLLLAFINTVRGEKGLNALAEADLSTFHRDRSYDLLAETVRSHLDMDRLYQIMGL